MIANSATPSWNESGQVDVEAKHARGQVFVTGASGVIGQAVTREFVSAGYQVTGCVRREGAISRLRRDGAEPLLQDLRDPGDSLVRAVAAADVIAHAAYTFDEDAAAVDHSFIELVEETWTCEGTRARCFLYTSGLWVLGNTGPEPADEDARLEPIDKVRDRPSIESHVLSLNSRSVIDAHVIRPGVVYGDGLGLACDMVEGALRRGSVIVVGDGSERWPTVHRTDLARLYRLVAESGLRGQIWHGVDESGIRVDRIAGVAALLADGAPILNVGVSDAGEWFGDFAEALSLDQCVSGAKARSQLGWDPSGQGIVESLYECRPEERKDRDPHASY